MASMRPRLIASEIVVVTCQVHIVALRFNEAEADRLGNPLDGTLNSLFRPWLQ